MKLTLERYNRDTHPQGFAGRGCTVIGKGIKCDIDTVVQVEMIVQCLDPPEVLHPVWLYPAFPELAVKIFLYAGKAEHASLEQQPGFGNLLQQRCPGVEDSGVELRDRTEGAECKIAVIKAGGWSHGWSWRRLVTQEAASATMGTPIQSASQVVVVPL